MSDETKQPDPPKCRKTPCSGCPFSRHSPMEKAGKVSPFVLLGQVYGPFVLPCHQEPGYEKGVYNPAHAHCAGAATFRGNVEVGDRVTHLNLPVLPKNTLDVVATPAELLMKHLGWTEAEANGYLDNIRPDSLMLFELGKNGGRIGGQVVPRPPAVSVEIRVTRPQMYPPDIDEPGREGHYFRGYGPGCLEQAVEKAKTKFPGERLSVRVWRIIRDDPQADDRPVPYLASEVFHIVPESK